ncbi:MAG: UDP-N-acetylmuramate--L-alanine ligase [Gammaproteobacteria bacterium]|nr:UDP-N-acetylmuramate--L-alanine ligase [Gammaproteobacteria bacterium]
MRRIRHVHFVGIGGAGMCGIAEVLIHEGYQVSGSDIAEGATVERLRDLGARVMIGHAAQNVDNADVVVASSAVGDSNPEVREARGRRVPVVPRAEMLGELMRFRQGIAIAGTHGKTTTTSLAASLFAEAGLDPTFVIGGLLNSAGSNAQLGSGNYVIAEADESDASFLQLQPLTAVLTNIDGDHLAFYDNSFDKLRETFLSFVHNLPFYGLLVACIDDPEVRRLLPDVQRQTVTYGFSPDADFRAENFHQEGPRSSFTVRHRGQALDITLDLPGRHNALNALAAVALATEEGIAAESITQGLAGFAGVGRRFEFVGEFAADDGAFVLVDDYGHHPTEVAVTVSAARECWPGRRVVMVYQPHRYTRTALLFDEFVRVLSDVDVLILADVYAAGEVPIEGARGEDLYAAIAAPNVHFVEFLESAPSLLEEIVEPGDVVLTQGAGKTSQLAGELKNRWSNRTLEGLS